MPRLRWKSAVGILLLVAINAGCSRPSRPSGYPDLPDRGEFSIMSYNLQGFGYRDRDGDGQANDFMPENQIEAIVEMIRVARPDILTLQEIGDVSSLSLLQERLARAELPFVYADHVSGQTPDANLGILSRHPIVSRVHLTNFTYSIRDRPLSVRRGFQQADVAISGIHTVRIINVHLKTKAFHEAGQTEMRRNEARLLATHVRRLLRENPAAPLVVCGDFSDQEHSGAMRELIRNPSTPLQALPMEDGYGDTWTVYHRQSLQYACEDYFLVTESMARRWKMNKSGIVRDRRAKVASDHRPIIASFTVKD